MANVKVVIDVSSNSVQIAGQETLTLTKQVKILKQELQLLEEAGKGNTAEFALLAKTYNDTQDKLSVVNVKSKELFGTMSALPGPIGAVAGQLDNTVGILKTFSSLKFSDIKAQITGLGDDFKGIITNLGTLTGVTGVYTATLNRFTGAAGVASTATKVLAASVATLYAALGVGVIMAVVYAFSKLESSEETVKKSIDATTDSIKKQNEAFELNKKVAANNSKAIIDQMTLQGFSEKEIREKVLRDARIQQVQANKELTDIRIKYNENETELLRLQGISEYSLDELNVARKKEIAKQNKGIFGKEIDERKLAVQAANINLLDLQVKYYEEDKQKTEDAIKKSKDQRDKDLADIKKNAIDATTSLLTDREQQRQKITDFYAGQIALAKQYGKDTYVLEEAQRNAQKELADKFAQEDKDKANKILEERLNANKAAYEFQRKQFEELANLDKQRADNVRLQNDVITQSWISLGNNIAGVLGSLANAFSNNETLQKIFAVTQVAVNTASSIGSISLSGRTQQADYNKAIAAGNSTIAIGIANAFIPGMQVLAAGQLASGKAAVAAGIAGKAASKINTGVQIGAAAAIGAAQIYAILSAKRNIPSASSEGGGDSGGTSTPAFSAPAIGAPQIGATSAQEGTIAGIAAGSMAANQSTGRPLRAYVVGNDITTEQQLDRRLRTMARLGG